jgi:hypothetical protein
MKLKFNKPIKYCKYWKICPDFKRSYCNENDNDLDLCIKYHINKLKGGVKDDN